MRKKIILLDYDLAKSAEYLMDSELKFLILHLANCILYLIHRIYGMKSIPLGYTNLPESYRNVLNVFLSNTLRNYMLPCWILYFCYLCEEYRFRFEKEHPSEKLFDLMRFIDTSIVEESHKKIAFNLYPNSKSKKDFVNYYRKLYKANRYQNITYTKRKMPQWFMED